MIEESKREDAYQFWARQPNKRYGANKKTSMHTGIPVRTIEEWIVAHDWRGRWLRDVGAVAPDILQEGLTIMVQGWPDVANRLMSVINNGTDKDATNAIRVYAAIGGVQQNQSLAPQKSGDRRNISVSTVEEVKKMTPDELWKRAVESGANNIDQALKIRTRKGIDSGS